jgi:predicted HTH transcriptional regulator
MDKIEKTIEEQLLADVKYDKKQLTDPAEIGILIHRLLQERKQANSVLEKIFEKLEELAASKQESPKVMLSDVDEKLIAHIQRAGKVDAEEIQAVFRYKGKNGASARLNVLYQRGLLMKGRAGKKVLYWVQG